jgi:hypothetical protein
MVASSTQARPVESARRTFPTTISNRPRIYERSPPTLNNGPVFVVRGLCPLARQVTSEKPHYRKLSGTTTRELRVGAPKTG